MRISDRSSDVCSSNQDRAEGKTGGKKRGPFWKRIRPATLVVLALLVGASMVRAVDPEWVEVLRVKTFDLYQVLSPRPATSQPVAIVDLDAKSPSEPGQWPVPPPAPHSVVKGKTWQVRVDSGGRGLLETKTNHSR